MSASADDQLDFENKLNDFYTGSYMGGSADNAMVTPRHHRSISSGMFIAHNSIGGGKYMTWGLFEDEVLNSEFGFKFDRDDMDNTPTNDKTSFQVLIDSSNSYTYYNDKLVKRQEKMEAELNKQDTKGSTRKRNKNKKATGPATDSPIGTMSKDPKTPMAKTMPYKNYKKGYYGA